MKAVAKTTTIFQESVNVLNVLFGMILVMVKLNSKMPKRVKITCPQGRNFTKSLAIDISEDYDIDSIVALSRGGLVPARYIATELDVDNIYTLGIRFYDRFNKKLKTPIIYQGFTHTFKRFERILIVDDIVDTGESIKTAVDLVTASKGRNIITCSLHYKPKSSIKPDYYYKEVSDNTWIVYDWEK